MLTARGVEMRFGSTVALESVSLAVQPGQVLALVGENGSGKSTLMRVLCGELSPDAGAMTLDDAPYRPRSPLEAMRAGVALIHQEPALCPHLSVWENIFLGHELKRGPALSKPRMRAEARIALAQLGFSWLDAEARVSTLTPAPRQIVEIARAIRSQARVLLFDEPTSSLGREEIEALFAAIRSLREKGCAIVYISHFLDEVMEIADRMAVLRDGRIVGEIPAESATVSGIAALMVGRELGSLYVRSNRQPGRVALRAEGLVGHRAPSGASLKLREGEVLGIAGLNGAGRTETVRCLFGLDKKRAGEVSILGSQARSPRDSWRAGAGFVSEDRKWEGLALKLSIAENLVMPTERGGLVNRRSVRERSAELIGRLGVKCVGPLQAVGALSGGNQQKVAIGRLLDSQAKVWILDEPTRGIDMGAKAEIYRLIDERTTAGGATIVVSSYLPELLGICDRIAVMRRGQIVNVFDARSTGEQELMEACTVG
jgi:ribose transport system ATP-binding protein